MYAHEGPSPLFIPGGGYKKWHFSNSRSFFGAFTVSFVRLCDKPAVQKKLLHASIIDGRYNIYRGTAKLTHKSVDNEELTFRILGAPVKEALEKFAGNRLVGGTPWQQPLSFHVSGQEMKGLVSAANLPE